MVISMALCSLTFGMKALADDSIASASADGNAAPIAENMQLDTFREISITGKFSAIDPEGDLMTYAISSDPKKGTIEMISEDEFCYTPKDGKKGKDTFTYTAIDTAGNVSAEATVTVNIKKQSTDICYSDMIDDSSHYAALTLAEEGIFTGEQLGNEYLFHPAQSISRSEFLAMCLKLCNVETIDSISKTGFYDDSDIPMWAKTYVAAGLMSDIIQGHPNEEGKLVFSAGNPITFAEAAVILNNILEITDVGSGDIDETLCPSWAYQATLNLSACDIIPSTTTSVFNNAITRADAAEMLCGAISVLEARDEGSSLLSWAKK